MIKKPIVAMDIASNGKGGGPYTSTMRIINSGLREIYDFKIIHYRNELGRGISIKRIYDLVKQIRQINPDIVHFSGLQLSGFHMAIACKIAGIKNTLITIHGSSADAIYFPWFKKLISVYLLESITLLLVKKNCSVSDFVTTRINKIFQTKSVGTIYNFPPMPLNIPSTIRKELGIKNTDLVLVTVARIIKDKGYHIFDEAILRFKNSENLKIIIVGDGSYINEMKLKLADQIENNQIYFLGYRDDVQQILKGSDIFILPTLHETLSIALLEASVEGLALIASNTGGVPEIITNEYNGILVEPGNVDKLTEAIELLVNNQDLRRKYSKNAQQIIAQKFSNKTIEAKIDNTYKNLLGLSQ